eukprot:scaffold134404_cov66-Attheya_sp.AAC.2
MAYSDTVSKRIPTLSARGKTPIKSYFVLGAGRPWDQGGFLLAPTGEEFGIWAHHQVDSMVQVFQQRGDDLHTPPDANHEL